MMDVVSLNFFRCPSSGHFCFVFLYTGINRGCGGRVRGHMNNVEGYGTDPYLWLMNLIFAQDESLPERRVGTSKVAEYVK